MTSRQQQRLVRTVMWAAWIVSGGLLLFAFVMR